MAAGSDTPPDQAEGAPHPRDTPQVFGHTAPDAAFTQAWEAGRPHHAWLLTGPKGVGKATFAYLAARRVLSMEADPAAIDRRMRAGSEPRLFVAARRLVENTQKKLRPETAITVATARDLLSFLELSAAAHGWRVVLIDAAEEMNAAAANAVLKRLEEPPPRTLFFLISHAPDRLLPTIRSRCRRLGFSALPPDDFAAALDQAEYDEPPDETLALLTGGAPGAAFRLSGGGAAHSYRALLEALAAGPRIDRRLVRQWGAQAAPRPFGKGDDAFYHGFAVAATRLCARLAAAIAGAPCDPPLIDAERVALSRLPVGLPRAAAWAAAAASVGRIAEEARVLNLDAALAILDMCVALERARNPEAP